MLITSYYIPGLRHQGRQPTGQWLQGHGGNNHCIMRNLWNRLRQGLHAFGRDTSKFSRGCSEDWTASQEPERWWLHQLHPLFFIPFCWACWAGFSVSRGALAKTDLPFVNRGTKAKLACFAGTLKPNAYICQEDKCKAVTGPVRDGIGWNVEHYIVWFNSGYITG
jgi:hypothetical protein